MCKARSTNKDMFNYSSAANEEFMASNSSNGMPHFHYVPLILNSINLQTANQQRVHFPTKNLIILFSNNSKVSRMKENDRK